MQVLGGGLNGKATHTGHLSYKEQRAGYAGGDLKGSLTLSILRPDSPKDEAGNLLHFEVPV